MQRQKGCVRLLGRMNREIFWCKLVVFMILFKGRCRGLHCVFLQLVRSKLVVLSFMTNEYTALSVGYFKWLCQHRASMVVACIGMMWLKCFVSKCVIQVDKILEDRSTYATWMTHLETKDFVTWSQYRRRPSLPCVKEDGHLRQKGEFGKVM